VGYDDRVSEYSYNLSLCSVGEHLLHVTIIHGQHCESVAKFGKNETTVDEIRREKLVYPCRMHAITKSGNRWAIDRSAKQEKRVGYL